MCNTYFPLLHTERGHVVRMWVSALALFNILAEAERSREAGTGAGRLWLERPRRHLHEMTQRRRF